MAVLDLIVPIALLGAVGAAVFLMFSAIRRRSPRIATLVAAGTTAHALSAALLFGISWFDAPVLRDLHSGDGFWDMAPDATLYYQLAAEAASQGLDAIRPGSPSPTFVGAIAIMMDGIGIHPAVPLLFNLVCFVAACACMSAAATGGVVPDRALVWPIAGLSFAPILMFCGTQVLKDTLFVFLTVVTAIGARELLRRIEPGPARSWARASIGAGVVVLMIGLLAGVRAYYPVLVMGAFGLVAGVAIVRRPRRLGWRYAAAVIVLLVGGWASFRVGAGAYYEPYARLGRNAVNTVTGGVLAPYLASRLPTPADPRRASVATVLDAARDGFALSGGGTNLVRAQTLAETTTASDGIRARAGAVAIGLSAILVPAAALRALSIVEFTGGRGLLLFSDVDTVFLGLLALGVVWTLWRERRALRGQGVYVAFCLCLSVITAVLLAYVVTNLGTLVRLRLLMHVPLWMAVLGISARPQVQA